MRARLVITFLLLLVVSASTTSLFADPVVHRGELFSIIPYIFFDSASSDPARYHRFTDRAQTAGFSESSLSAATLNADSAMLDIHHEVLNIIGSRMRAHPKTTIRIVGTCSDHQHGGESVEVSKARGEVVYRYLVEIWGIAPERITLMPARGLPQMRSNIRDPRGVKENRRAEILSDDWELLRPVHVPARVNSEVFIVWLVQFKFDSPEMGPLNQRILKEYVYPAIKATSSINVACFTDDDRPDDRCLNRAAERAHAVVKAIKANVKSLGSIMGKGVPYVILYDPSLPEGTMHSRTVQIVIR